MDRASTFSDAETRALINERTIPVAADCWYYERGLAPGSEWYQRVVAQRPGLEKGRSTQGFYVASAEGRLLRGWNNRGAARLAARLEEALAAAPAAPQPAAVGPPPARFPLPTPPSGSLVLDVFARITAAGWPQPESAEDQIFREGLGRDHAWILPEEADALVRGEVAESLLRRIARFHLVDNTRGEPPHWTAAELAGATLRLELERELAPAGDGAPAPAWRRLQLRGAAELRSADGARTYAPVLHGHLEITDGRVARFDLLATGPFRGQGEWTPGAPDGTFTLTVAFGLAAGGGNLEVPPQGARDPRDYRKP